MVKGKLKEFFNYFSCSQFFIRNTWHLSLLKIYLTRYMICRWAERLMKLVLRVNEVVRKVRSFNVLICLVT